ncbi:pilin [Candidatus Avelusimicrobium sp.]
MKKGFTLVELLVVVLIIGILSAVALPQYQKAVHKARITEGLIRAKAMRDAAQLYFMENGWPSSGATDLGEVNPDLVAGLSKGTDGMYRSKYFSYSAMCQGGVDECVIQARYSSADVSLNLVHRFYGSSWDLSCQAWDNSPASESLCKQMASQGYRFQTLESNP